MSLLYDDNYEPTNSTEIDDVLAELPFDLIQANITEQINDPMSTNVNYVEVIVDKCNTCKEYYEDEDVAKQIDLSLENFFRTVITEIDNRFNLGLDINDIATSSSITELGEVLYEYFIIRYKKNIEKFVTNYIKKHSDELADYYSDRMKKDVSTLAHKKQVTEQKGLIIISNLPSIINYIVDLDIEPFEFVNLSAGESNYNANVVKGLISTNRMVGDFVRPYIGISLDDHDYLIDEIQTDIKVRIIKKNLTF